MTSGATAFTRTPFGPSWMAIIFIAVISADLEAPYTSCPKLPSSAVMLKVKLMLPRPWRSLSFEMYWDRTIWERN